MERGDLPELTQDKNLVSVTFLGTLLPITPKLNSPEEEELIGILYPSASPNQNPSNQTVLRCEDPCDKPTDETAVPLVFFYSVDIVQDD
eukprot:scaffold391886_cov47-Attheya_sp.AAC.1